MGRFEQIAAVLGPALLDSPWVARLGRISFLGALDWQPDVVRVYSRLDHSLAVATLGTSIARRSGISARARRTFVAASLLHDVGHFPLSHSAESGFVRALQADHHLVSKWIILGDGPIGRGRSLAPVLDAVGVQPADVWRLVGGQAPRWFPREIAATLNGRVNIDTFDGIRRVARAFGIRTVALSDDVFELARTRACLTGASVRRVDAFWRLKRLVYRDIVNRPSNILVEERLAAIAAERATAELFDHLERLDDDSVMSWFRGVRPDPDLDREWRVADGAGPHPRDLKDYAIRESAVPGSGLRPPDWGRRYRHWKRAVHLEAVPGVRPHASEGGEPRNECCRL
jgi:hypothetical protein